jgi:hypothetical protein
MDGRKSGEDLATHVMNDEKMEVVRNRIKQTDTLIIDEV